MEMIEIIKLYSQRMQEIADTLKSISAPISEEEANDLLEKNIAIIQEYYDGCQYIVNQYNKAKNIADNLEEKFNVKKEVK